MNIKYRHYITHSSVQTEVFPLNFKENCTLDWEDQDTEIFKRKVLKGSLNFGNRPEEGVSDYTYFKAINDDNTQRCDELSYELQRSCDNGATYTTFWNGYFVVTDGEFDLDRCRFSVEPLPDDAYRCILENQEKEFTISVVGPIRSSTFLIPDYEYFICRDSIGACNSLRPTPVDGWTVFHTEVIDSVTTTIYYREQAIVACEAGSPTPPDDSGSWSLDSSGAYPTCVYGLAKYVRTPTTIYTNNPNPYVQAGNCNDDGSYSPPPHRQRLVVTKSNSASAPIVVGKSVVFGGCSETYSVKYPKNNATYLWSITGTGNSITSGSTTSQVTCSIANTGTISVVETTPCGASASGSQAFTIGPPAYNSETAIIGNTEMCVGETQVFFFNASTGRTLIDLNANSTIVNGGGGFYEITALAAGLIILDWNGGGVCDSLAVPGLTITVLPANKKRKTVPIYGASSVCQSDQTSYFAKYSSTGTYTWKVVGGTILAGQGTAVIFVEWDGSAGTGYVYLQEEINGDCSCEWILITDPDGAIQCDTDTHPPFYFCPPISKTVYDKTRLLYDMFNYFRTAICPAINSITSDFFEWNPIGDTPGYLAGNNYVTGATNHVNLLALAEKADMLGLTSENPNSKLSWKILTEIVRECFQVYWYIDSLGNARFEHIKYYLRSVKFDLTSIPFKSKSFYRNIFSYQKDKRPKYERFHWSEAISTDFVGSEISYSSLCVNKNSKENVSSNGLSYITTDLAYIATSPSRINKDGWALIALELSSGMYAVAIEAGLITTIPQPNAHLSWANLHYNYFRYYRVLLEGTMNLISQTFLSVKRTKIQKGVKFNYCCSDDLDGQTDLITTQVGDGSISGASLSLKSDLLQTDLLFESDE